MTSVHPDYYTENLKKFTDELVYIPYYILGEGGMPDSHRSLPSYQYIDKIIVQDEDKKESMLDFVPEEKIAAIGCPKVDRLLKLDKKKQEILEHEIPQEWREKIAGKKVILFNISITGILNNKRYAMKKIRYVLSCFENRDDVVLLWRPHPLVEATLKSMRPELYGEYMEIKDSFVRKGEGILDETGDAGIAAVVADAYLGENSSSLVHYFGVLGKPVMYIDWAVTEDKKKNRGFFSVHSFFKENDNVFFVPIDEDYFAHDLYKLNIECGSIQKVMTFPGSSDDIWGCYFGIKKVQNKIILMPHNAEDIYVYDIKKKLGMKIFLPDFKIGKRMFNEAVEYNEKLFLVPRCYPAILSIDVQSMEICEYRECIEPFLLEDKNEQMFNWAYFQKEEYLYLASCNDSRIIIFNMKDYSYEIKKIGDYPYGYYRMIYDGEYFWLAAYKINHIVRWNEHSGDTREYTYPVEQKILTEWRYYSSLLNKGSKIMVCNAFSANIICLDKQTGECKEEKITQKIFSKLQKSSIDDESGFGYAKHLDAETAILFATGDYSINIWNMYTNQWRHFPCRIPRNELLRIEKERIEKYLAYGATPYSLWETTVTIPQFSDYIANTELEIFRQTYDCYQEKESGSTIGVKVHSYIKE